MIVELKFCKNNNYITLIHNVLLINCLFSYKILYMYIIVYDYIRFCRVKTCK